MSIRKLSLNSYMSILEIKPSRNRYLILDHLCDKYVFSSTSLVNLIINHLLAQPCLPGIPLAIDTLFLTNWYTAEQQLCN